MVDQDYGYEDFLWEQYESLRDEAEAASAERGGPDEGSDEPVESGARRAVEPVQADSEPF